MPARALPPRPRNAGRAGGGLNVLPRPFDVTEGLKLWSTLRHLEADLRWADAFVRWCGGVRELHAHEARYAALPRHVVACTTPGCGYRLERPRTKGRTPKCPDCGAWTRTVTGTADA